jgi:LCP family protein required for cell wall assembly
MNMKRMDRRKKSNKKPDLLTIILGGAFVIATLVTAFFAFRFVKENIAKTNVIDLPGVSISSSSSDTEGQNDTPSTDDGVDPPPADSNSSTDLGIQRVEWDGVSRVNILIMGLDYRDWEAGESAARTDSMMVLTLDPTTMKAGLLSIPRDLWVNVPGFDQNKINTAYFLGETNHLPGGGPALATKTVEEFLGIDIHYYAQIDFNTFVQFVDFMGGVKFDVTQQIKLEIPGGETVKLKPGRYNLSGSLALAYARNRYTGDGDFDRAQRQQQLLLAIREQLFRPDIQGRILGNPQGVWDIFSEGIRTNIPFGDAFALGMMALELDREDIIQRVITPPEYVTYATSPDGLQVLKPITNKIRILRDEMFTNSTLIGPVAAGGDPTQLMLEEAASVAVYNGSVISGLAGATQEYLLGLGVNVVEIGNADLVPSTTIYDYTGNPYTLQYLVNLFGIENTRIFNSFDPDSTVDVAVVLGSEWVVPTGQ